LVHEAFRKPHEVARQWARECGDGLTGCEFKTDSDYWSARIDETSSVSCADGDRWTRFVVTADS